MSEDIFKVQQGQNEAEIKFLSCLYFAPRTCKTIAFSLDLGSTKSETLKRLPKNADKRFLNFINTFIDFYLSKPERAKELMSPYSRADYPLASR